MRKGLEQNIASHILISNKDNLFLILRRSRIDKYDPNLWDLPGGGIKSNETLEEGIKREVLEETGLDIGKVYILGVYTIDGRDMQLLTKAELHNSKQKVKVSKEHSSYKWVDIVYLLDVKFSSFHLKAAQNILRTKNKLKLKSKFKYKGKYYPYLS